MDVILDASVAIKWFAPEELSEKADQLQTVFHSLIVPDRFFAEMANIVWGKRRLGLMPEAVAKEIMTSLEHSGGRMVTADRRLLNKIARTPWRRDILPLSEVGAVIGQSH